MDAESQQVEALSQYVEELKDQIDVMNEAHKVLMTEKDQLITELCDAIEKSGYYVGESSLIQRAREATR